MATMNPDLDLADLPSYAHLNRAQKRAFILRDKLKYTEKHHLDSFLAGIESPEPPTYRNINGKVVPPFLEVGLKKEAKKLDLGNVRFHERDRTFIKRAFLVIEGGNCELKETKPLPSDDDNLLSVPIEAYSVESTVPLFLAKYEAIEARRHHLNEVRRAAFTGAEQYEVQVNKGKSLSKLHSESFELDGSIHKPRPRAPGDPIPRHVSNKRKRIGLAGIPVSIKAEALNQIPDHLKLNLFDAIVKNAFPHFDNLMMAAWNVVSLFSGTGTEENDLLRAVSQLDAVLREFDSYETTTNRLKKTEVDEKEAQVKGQKVNTAIPHGYQSQSESSRISTPVAPRATPAAQHSSPWGARVPPPKQQHSFNPTTSQYPTDGYAAEDDEEDEETEDLIPRRRPNRQYSSSMYPPPHGDPRHHPYAPKPLERPSSSSASLTPSGYPPYPYNQPYQGYPIPYHPQQHHQLYPSPTPPPPPSSQHGYAASPYQPPTRGPIPRKFSMNPQPQPSPSSTRSTPAHASRAQRPPSRQVYTDGNRDGHDFAGVGEQTHDVSMNLQNDNHASSAAAATGGAGQEEIDFDASINSLFEDLDSGRLTLPPAATTAAAQDDTEMHDTPHSAGPPGDETAGVAGTREDGAADGADEGQAATGSSGGIYLGRSALGKRKERTSEAPSVADMFGTGEKGGQGGE